MQSIALLIHDIHFPYALFEEALQCAYSHGAAFKAVFLTNEPIYIQPEELMRVQDTAPTLIGGAQQIIARHLRMLHQRSMSCFLPFSSVILVSPPLQQVVEQLRRADRVYAELYDESLFSDWSFSREELMRRMPGKIPAMAV